MEGWGGLWAEPSAFIERGFGQPVAERRGGSVCERSEHCGGGFAAQQHFGSTRCTGGVSGVADLPKSLPALVGLGKRAREPFAC